VKVPESFHIYGLQSAAREFSLAQVSAPTLEEPRTQSLYNGARTWGTRQLDQN
jgi:hypothetical protein